MATAAAQLLTDDVEYPASDGKPMAEADPHRKEMTYLIDALSEHFGDHSDVYVTGNLFLYYKRGDPSSVVAPDLFVVKGVPRGDRKTFRLWEEGRAPSFVLEVTSESTRREDEQKKKLYARLGVREYFRFDPKADYLSPPLQGFRLGGSGGYRRLRPAADGALKSRALGVTFALEDERLRLLDSRTGERLLRFEEARAEARSEAVARRAVETEAVAQAARAAQQAIRAAQESARAKRASARAEQEAARAEAERASRRSLEAQLERLKRRLDEREAGGP